jgi:hypothetical protein
MQVVMCLRAVEVANSYMVMGINPLAQWLAPWLWGSNLTTAVWGSDLMVKNPRDPSHLRIRELWVRVVVSLIIAQMCLTPFQIQVQVG